MTDYNLNTKPHVIGACDLCDCEIPTETTTEAPTEIPTDPPTTQEPQL